VIQGMIGLLVSTWIWLGILGLIAVLFVGFVVTFFLAAYFEKRRLLPLTPIADAVLPDDDSMPGRTRAAALRAGFHDAGMFQDHGAIVANKNTLMLSSDQLVLLLIIHSKVFRYRLMSRLADGSWLTTGEYSGEPDLTGLTHVELIRAGIPEQEAQHRRALTRFTPVPFDPQTIPEALLDHERRRLQILMERGNARWRTPDNSVWSYSFVGSIRVTLAGMSEIQQAIQAAKTGPKQP
jgi:hypothetical protein